MSVSRRQALALLGAGAAVPACSTTSTAGGAARFTHGVASGDPAADGAVLWTRALPAGGRDGAVPLRWTVMRDGEVAARGEARAEPGRDHCVKPVVTGLRPGTDYTYVFEGAGGGRSPPGRFRTLPTGAASEAVFAVVSCQLYGGGLFNAYEAVAALPRLDAVIHLGDYIYEYGVGRYGGDTERALGRVPDPPHEIVTLADYRRRHAQYRSDPDLQAAHARAAFITVWDDHETANDCWVDGAQNHDEGEGSWRARKAAALQAYDEWMPIRQRGPSESIYRRFDFGELATLLMVETRLLARSEQLAFKGEAPTPADYQSLLADLRRPERELLGATQARWLEEQLRDGRGKPWSVIGNQVMVARVRAPDLERTLGRTAFAAALALLPAGVAARVRGTLAAGRAGVPLNLDAWDGYPAARERLYASWARAGAHPLVLTGDTHAFWANRLHDASGRPVGNEIGTSSITSPSLGDALGGLDLGGAIAQANDEVLWSNQSAKGFTLLRLTPTLATAEFHAVSTIRAKPFTSRTVARFVARPGEAIVRT